MSAGNGIMGVLSSRLSSAFLFSFVVSFAAWNYRAIFVLFSRLDVRERFEYIDNVIYANNSKLVFLLILPLASATAYILLGPWLIVGWSYGDSGFNA